MLDQVQGRDGLRRFQSLTVKTARVKPGGTGFMVPPSMRVVGAGEENTIEWDNYRESALAFVVRTFRHFHYIFEVAPIPPAERVIPNLGNKLLDAQDVDSVI